MVSINNEMGDITSNKGKKRKSLENIHVMKHRLQFIILVSIMQNSIVLIDFHVYNTRNIHNIIKIKGALPFSETKCLVKERPTVKI